MNSIYKKECAPCKTGADKMSSSQIESQIQLLSGWDIIKQGEISQLRKTFKFKNFEQALKFTNKISEIAESEDHHPSILLEWGKVMITWWTHTVQGLHINDFIMAAKTDNIL